MIKRIGLIKRQRALSTEEFRSHWLDRHSLMAREMPGLRGYRVNLVQSWEGTPEWWDGYGELWFDNAESMQSGFNALSPDLIVDRDRFASKVATAIVSEHVIV